MIEESTTDYISIYVTHGSLPASRSIARLFLLKENEDQVFALYEAQQYVLCTKHCTPFVAKILKNQLQIADLPDKHVLGDLDQLLQFVRSIGKPVHRVCCDVNLTLEARPVVSNEAHQLLKKSGAKQVLFINSTDKCTPNAEHYLYGEPLQLDDGHIRNQHMFQLPLNVTQGVVRCRTQVNEAISSGAYTRATRTEEQLKKAAVAIIWRKYSFFKAAKMQNSVGTCDATDVQSSYEAFDHLVQKNQHIAHSNTILHQWLYSQPQNTQVVPVNHAEIDATDAYLDRMIGQQLRIKPKSKDNTPDSKTPRTVHSDDAATALVQLTGIASHSSIESESAISQLVQLSALNSPRLLHNAESTTSSPSYSLMLDY